MLQKINPFLSQFIKLLFLWQKQVVALGLVTLHHCCKQIFLCLGWKNGGFFEYEVYLLFTAGEVGGLTGVVFSIYKSTLILNIKLINNFCLHTHLFHKIRGKGLLELHFVSIMYLLTASYLDTIYLALICSRPLTLVFHGFLCLHQCTRIHCIDNKTLLLSLAIIFRGKKRRPKSPTWAFLLYTYILATVFM